MILQIMNFEWPLLFPLSTHYVAKNHQCNFWYAQTIPSSVLCSEGNVTN